MSEESFFFFSLEDGPHCRRDRGGTKLISLKRSWRGGIVGPGENGRLAFDNEAYHTALDRDRTAARPCCAHFSRVRPRGHSSRRIEAEW